MQSMITLFLGILFLLFLIVKVKLNTFISLIFTAVMVGLGLGMDFAQIPHSISQGIGGSLGELAIVFGFGAILGRLVSDAGGAYRIAHTLIEKFGKKRIQLAVMVAAFILGIALFFEVGMVILIPIIFVIALEVGVPLLYLGIPMAAALSVTHGFLPPHPAPTAIATALGANTGEVLFYGLIVAIPAAIVAGPLFTKLAQKYAPEAFTIKRELSSFGEIKEFDLAKTPSFGLSLLTSLFPVLLMGVTTIYTMVNNNGKPFTDPQGFDSFVTMIGSPVGAMIISLLFALWAMGWHQQKSAAEISTSVEESVRSIAMLLLIIGGGAAFKQILIDGGIADQVALMFQGSTISPLLLAWIITVILRVALGSATVAALTAAGLVGPLMAGAGINPALMVLVIGAGSLAASHVNDAGFWMFKEYFDLDVKQTLKIWTVLETVISVVGLIIVLILSMFV
ncbi:gluconate:H+ symporter [Weissella tructae]|uniref:GntT_2 protein n=2 Tax=Weissella TaxID=46255 RepID=A0A075U0N6_9LACO|nr:MULTISPECIES: gluconate:H+ symporter [Weissella]AIG66100.1 GntT_2 protein [Weissella tructae]AIM63480.1 GntT_2 protein [Weissella ceti]ELA07473.1 gluconate:H(+) symporter [Weissella ceti NC36]QVV91250.1 gluconate:H+ symporter [Weissella tructae]